MLVNLTPHELLILPPDGGELRVPPSGVVARCSEVTEPLGSVTMDGHEIPLVAKRFGELVGLPEPQDGTLYIVSAMAAQAAWAAGRTDVACPGDLVRDPSGRVVGCRSLCVAPARGN